MSDIVSRKGFTPTVALTKPFHVRWARRLGLDKGTYERRKAGGGENYEDVRVTITSTLCTQVFSPISDFWPGLSMLTLARASSRLGQCPLWDNATPRGTPSEKATRRGRRPVSLATIALSPSARPRSAASAGRRAMVAGPRRAEILPTLAKLSLNSQGEAGDNRRRRPLAGLGSASGSGTRGWPSASARAEAAEDLLIGQHLP
jgi:hypothetical protein